MSEVSTDSGGEVMTWGPGPDRCADCTVLLGVLLELSEVRIRDHVVQLGLHVVLLE